MIFTGSTVFSVIQEGHLGQTWKNQERFPGKMNSKLKREGEVGISQLM